MKQIKLSLLALISILVLSTIFFSCKKDDKTAPIVLITKGPISQFVEKHYKHFNAAALLMLQKDMKHIYWKVVK
jgi:hypothetical protein